MSFLQQGYWRGKTLPEPVLTEIPKIKVDKNMEPIAKHKRLNLDGTPTYLYVFGPEGNLNYANAYVSMERIAAGSVRQWYFPYDSEFHYILQGKAEMTYSLDGSDHTQLKTMSIEEGDVFIIPRGARIKWKMSDDMDMVRLIILIPGIPAPERKPGTVEQSKK